MIEISLGTATRRLHTFRQVAHVTSTSSSSAGGCSVTLSQHRERDFWHPSLVSVQRHRIWWFLETQRQANTPPLLWFQMHLTWWWLSVLYVIVSFQSALWGSSATLPNQVTTNLHKFWDSHHQGLLLMLQKSLEAAWQCNSSGQIHQISESESENVLLLPWVHSEVCLGERCIHKQTY